MGGDEAMFIKLDHNDIKILLEMFEELDPQELTPDEVQVQKKLELILLKQTAKFNRIKETLNDNNIRTESEIESR